jgi:hypothetical protein
MSYASIPAWPLTRDDGNAVVARSLHLCVLRLFTADDEELHVGGIETHATRLTESSPACKWEMTGRRAERDPRWSPTLAAFRWLGLTLPI